MIVRVRVNGHAAPLNPVANVNPTAQLCCAVDDRLVPDFCGFFDAFAVPEPANVSEIRSDGVKLFE